MEIGEAILVLSYMIALGVMVIAPFALVGAWTYRRKIRREVSCRGGRLVRINPPWVFRLIVKGWRVGRRIRFEWVDGADRLHVSECEFMHLGMEGLVGCGKFLWLGDVDRLADQGAEPGVAPEPRSGRFAIDDHPTRPGDRQRYTAD